MIFGFCNVPSKLIHDIDTMLFGILDNAIIIYLDKNLICGKDMASYSKALYAIF